MEKANSWWRREREGWREKEKRSQMDLEILFSFIVRIFFPQMKPADKRPRTRDKGQN